MRLLPTLLACIAFAAPALAQTEAGDLLIACPMLRDTPPNAPVAGGFVTITNAGPQDDRLIAAAAEAGVAGDVQLHQMKMTDGVMEMSQVEAGIPVPAGQTLRLAPGGLHIMLMGLQAPLTAGESHTLTLTFEAAGEVTVAFPVRTLGEIRAALGEGDATGRCGAEDPQSSGDTGGGN